MFNSNYTGNRCDVILTRLIKQFRMNKLSENGTFILCIPNSNANTSEIILN